jgi:NAD(P)-dependent dehydrogenase (short-subunit alcohol dehydrogenase family)
VTRTALVTGGNRGIGYEICRELVALGLSVVLTARDAGAADRAAEELGARPEQLDVADRASVAECARRLADDSVDVDVLVNNAGLYTTTPLLRVDEDDLMETLQVNFIGAWRTSRAWVPGMRRRGYGRVVNIATGYGATPSEPPRAGAYGLAKAGLNMLTRMLASEAGPTVKVNSMSPGWVATRMGGAGAPRTVEEGAATAVWLATLPEDGPTGGFFYEKEQVPW